MYNNAQIKAFDRNEPSAVEARMKQVSFSEFRRNAASLLDAVEKGETIRVLRHGKPIAEVVPVPAPGDATLSWKKPGLALDIPGVSLSREIIRERALSEDRLLGKGRARRVKKRERAKR